MWSRVWENHKHGSDGVSIVMKQPNILGGVRIMVSTKPAIKTAGAPETLLWSCIDWDKTNSHVRRLQLRIAKAVREKK